MASVKVPVCPVIFATMLLCSALSVNADPIAITDVPIVRVGTIVTITLAILIEAVCIVLLLRRWKTPRFFIVWLLGMHLITYPLFLTVFWLLDGLRPALVATAAEGLIVLIEGSLIYLMCRFGPSAKREMVVPSISRSMIASLIGNVSSAAAFPVLMFLYDLVLSAVERLFY